jgi:hypothetical protein
MRGAPKSRKFRVHHRLSLADGRGRHIIMFRIGVGYWPCLRGPFLQVAFGKHIFELWYGLPSYKEPLAAVAGAAALAKGGSK